MAVLKTTCPYCLFGCELGIVSSQGKVQGVEYIKDSKINQGRLCARGNSAPLVLNHPRRLTEPLSDGKRVNWETALTEVVNIFKTTKPEEIAITFDKNLTEEERDLIFGFSRAFKVETVGSSYLEPDGYFLYVIPGAQAATLTDIRDSDLFILVGDVFSQMPVLAKPLLDARYRDRQHRIVVIDSLRTRTGFFADQLIITQPGTEPLLLFGVLQAMGGTAKPEGLDEIALACCVEVQQLRGLATMISRAKRVVVAAGTVLGRVDMPLLFALAPQIIAASDPDKIKFLGIGEAQRLVVGRGFGEILSLIKNRRVKVLFNFGESFPFDYPQLEPVLKKLDRLVASATFIPEKRGQALILPVPANLEKTGSIPTLWGYGRLTNPVSPPSGVKSISEILKETASRLSTSFNPTSVETSKVVDREEVFKKAWGYVKQRLRTKRRRAYNFTLLGERPAIEFQGLFVGSENRLKLSSDDCRDLNLKPGETVVLETAQATGEFIVDRIPSMPRQVVACSVSRVENRRLFEVVIDKSTGDCIIPFAAAKLWKKT